MAEVSRERFGTRSGRFSLRVVCLVAHTLGQLIPPGGIAARIIVPGDELKYIACGERQVVRASLHDVEQDLVPLPAMFRPTRNGIVLEVLGVQLAPVRPFLRVSDVAGVRLGRGLWGAPSE